MTVSKSCTGHLTTQFLRPAIHRLEQSQGYIVAVSSGVSHLIFPTGSDYCISKYTLDRLVEFIVTEYPRVKAFALHPGVVPTDMSRNSGVDMELPDSSELPASTMLWLTAGNADWLSGRWATICNVAVTIPAFIVMSQIHFF